MKSHKNMRDPPSTIIAIIVLAATLILLPHFGKHLNVSFDDSLLIFPFILRRNEEDL